jgi:SWI/SNF-related matrix-associated actin-dependent regulator of chromatin subfamily A containing DEAD/H box 1
MAEEILNRRHEINVIVTTYDMAAKKEDNKFMRRLRPDVSSRSSIHDVIN